MTTAPTIDRTVHHVGHGPASQWAWLGRGLAMAFVVPFLFADRLELNRDVYYGLYMASVATLVIAWVRAGSVDVRAALARNWRWGVLLGAVFAGVMTLIVLKTEDGTPHPQGADFVAALAWRGALYGLADGLLLSVFPILAVFAAFAGRPLLKRLRGRVAVGAAALAVSLTFTAVYHAGYPEFRSEQLRKPVAGDVLWSVPTLVTLSPLGAPIAHAGLHVAAVVHSYETETFLPPH